MEKRDVPKLLPKSMEKLRNGMFRNYFPNLSKTGKMEKWNGGGRRRKDEKEGEGGRRGRRRRRRVGREEAGGFDCCKLLVAGKRKEADCCRLLVAGRWAEDLFAAF